MDKVLHWLLGFDVFLLIVFSVRSLYWCGRFVRTIWIEDPDKAREYGIGPERLCGPIDIGGAIYSKDQCGDEELERLRQKARRSQNTVLALLLPFPFIVSGIIIPRIAKADVDLLSLIRNASGELFLVTLGGFLIFAVIITVIVFVRRLQIKKMVDGE